MTDDQIDRQALRRLLDKDAIREACAKYARGMDRHDDDLLTQVYHPGAVDDHGTYIGDAAGFIRHSGALHTSGWSAHQHYMLNQTIDFDGDDSAHVETYFIAALKRPDGTVDFAGGRYVDRFERRAGHWAVADRACVMEWTSELAQPKAPLDADLFLSGVQDRSDISYQRPLKLPRAHRELHFADGGEGSPRPVEA